MTAPNQQGISTQADVLVNRTADGIDLNLLWTELRDAIDLINKERTSIVNLLSYWHTETADLVPQGISSGDFEEATELGLPRSIIPSAETLILGYRLRDYDRATRFSWRFLRSASAEQVRTAINYILDSDNKLTTGLILQRLFSPVQSKNEFNHACYGLWNGTDGLVSPPYLGKTFDDTHNHFIVSGATQIDSSDIEDGIRHITEHGYGTKDTGSQLKIFANPDESEWIQSFRAGHESRPSGPVAKWSFVPSVSAPPYLTQDGATLVGAPAPAQYGGLDVLGSYGPAFLIESAFIPSGYVSIVSTNGPGSTYNPVGVRQHPDPSQQGLRQIPGNRGPYPLVESFSLRTVGVGTRHLGAAVIIEVKDSGSYDVPAKTEFGLGAQISV